MHGCGMSTISLTQGKNADYAELIIVQKPLDDGEIERPEWNVEEAFLSVAAIVRHILSRALLL